LAFWRHLQVNHPEFRRYRIRHFFPMLGVRETRRVLARYMLTQHVLSVGLSAQGQTDIITIADHAMDTHGSDTGRAGCRELKEPYGVPFRCLLPRDIDNLMVACRAAGFSSIAASSCRLSRTMIQLGQAAGTAAGIASELGVPPHKLPPGRLRDELRKQHVQLEWPISEAVRAHLLEE
jgi:hypothetical protein